MKGKTIHYRSATEVLSDDAMKHFLGGYGTYVTTSNCHATVCVEKTTSVKCTKSNDKYDPNDPNSLEYEITYDATYNCCPAVSPCADDEYFTCACTGG